MTFLPIVDRELRVAARRRVTYRTRTWLALGAIGVGCILYGANLFASPQQVGQYIFIGLSGLCLLHGLASGRRLTADCLSEEKRDGTLGLLFLTDLKGHDVVLGKLAATSLNGFYGLLAVLPVLAVPLLMGGISNAEFWRMALVLVDTFLFSLAIGIFVSAVSREARRALGSNFLLLLLLVGIPPACASAILFLSPAHRLIPELLYSCPVYAFWLSFDVRFAGRAEQFWGSVGVIHGLTWFLVALASWLAPRSWQDKPALPRAERGRWRRWWHAWSYGRPEKSRPFRRQLLDVNAFYWLAGRARLKVIHVWIFLLLAVGWWAGGWLVNERLWLDESVAIAMALILNTTLKLWVAVEAGQRLAEDRKLGALELLLSTPITIRDIVRGQFLALRRQFLGPLLATAFIELFLMMLSWRQTPGWRLPAFCLAGIVMLVTDIVAITWVAMLAALTAKTPQHATVETVGRLLILPWLAYGIAVTVANLWIALSSPSGAPLTWRFNLSLWLIVGIVADLGFGWLARWRLLKEFRLLALQQLSAVSPSSRLARLTARFKALNANFGFKRREGDTLHAPRHRLPAVLRRRKILVSGGIAVLAVSLIALSFRSRPKFPPPITVSLSQTNTPFRVFSGDNGVFLILPDGSLWRWGQAGGPRFPNAAVPERIGTDSDWIEADFAHNHCVGVRRNGTLWEWGIRAGNSFVNDPVRVDSGSNWVRASTGAGHSVVLRRDGTLWSWGNNQRNQLGNGPGPDQTQPVQVGADKDWADVHCQLAGTFALKRDGTLWTWGEFYSFQGGSLWTSNYRMPTQVCRETNWAGFANRIWAWPQLWTRTGELWDQFTGTPSPDTSASVIARQVLSGSGPDRVAFTYVGVPEQYEVRTDGTLWKRTYPYAPGMTDVPGEWGQAGKRTDWIAIWGSAVVVGLTADGTVWTWGLDPSQAPVSDFSTRFKLVQSRLAGWFGNRPGPTSTTATRPVFQRDPRPLMRLIPASAIPAEAAKPVAP